MNQQRSQLESDSLQQGSHSKGEVAVGIGIYTLAGLLAGLGSILGVFIGRNDGLPGSILPLGLVGMLVTTLPVIWMLPTRWRKRYVAVLPTFWFICGGSMIARTFFDGDNWFVSVIPVLGVIVGQAIYVLILNSSWMKTQKIF